jgi:NTP pyrophosphatase (non-canonical NTP hydrolase)
MIEMELDAYQIGALATAIYPTEYKIVYPTLGLVGEAGEVAEKIKKSLRGDAPLDRFEAARELGDVLWYLAALARDLGFTLEEVAEMNLQKLRDRRARNVLQGDGDNR